MGKFVNIKAVCLMVSLLSLLLIGGCDSISTAREQQAPTEAKTSYSETESQRLMDEMNVLSDRVQKCISENARISQDQIDYQQRYNELVSRYTARMTLALPSKAERKYE